LIKFSDNFEEYKKAITKNQTYLQKSKSSDIKNSIVKKENKDNEDKIVKIKKYLSNFKNIKITNKTKIVFEKNYFIIDNLKLGINKEISFKIYPEQNNFIDSIKIIENNIQKNIKSTYLLDNIKDDWDKINKNNSREKDKTKYDFKYFFVNTFDKTKKVEKIKEEKEINENDEYIENGKIIKLKRERLLDEEKGELSNLKDFMKVSYNKIFAYEKEN
jgi:hypothetical protein